jgi:hypothetical protein
MWIFWTILLVVIGVVLMIHSLAGDSLQGVSGMFSFMLLLAATTILNGHIKPKPTALDVYRGNTELEITSVNGIPTDTVVVFKNK